MFANNDETHRRRDKAEDVLARVEDQLRSVQSAPLPRPANSIVEEGILEAARQELRARRERARLFGSIVLSDPAWDILLTLFLASEEGRSADISSICDAVPVTQSAALRFLGHLVKAKMVTRQAEGAEAEIHLTLTQAARMKLCDYFIRTRADGGAAAA